MEFDIVTMLRAAWFAVILPIIIASTMPICKQRCFFFHQLLPSFAKARETMQSSSHKLTVPRRFISHFYMVAVVWTTLLLITTWLYAYRMAPLSSDEPFHVSHLASHLTGGSHIFSFHKSRLTSFDHRFKVWRTLLLLLLMEAQVIRRLFETFYLPDYSPSARIHIFSYLIGLFFYIAAPLSLCCTCAPEVFEFTLNLLSEFIVKGKNQMPAIEIDWWESVNHLMKLGWCQWVGIAIFLCGWILQHYCHLFSGALRKVAEQLGGHVTHTGDWFDIVSSPQYLTEIVIYAGLLIASGGGDLTIWLLFVSVVAKPGFVEAEAQMW